MEIIKLIMETVAIVLTIILGIYEVIARVIPSVGNNSILHFIIELLRKLSELLNRKKNLASLTPKEKQKLLKQIEDKMVDLKIDHNNLS